MYHPPNYLFSKSTKITLKIGVFDTISQCVAHRALCGRKRESHGPICLQSNVQSWKLPRTLAL